MNSGDSTNKSSARLALGPSGSRENMGNQESGASRQPLDFSELCGQFDVYQPSGQYGWPALIGLPLAGALVGAALAWPYAWLNYSGYIVSGTKLLASLAVWGLLSGWLAMQAVRLFKVRNPRLAMILSIFGFLIAWVASWPAIQHFCGSSLTLSSFFLRRLEGGVVVNIDHITRFLSSGGPDYRLFQGYYLVLCWLLEAGLYSLLAGIMASIQARRPFSEISGRWYTKINLGLLRLDPADLETLAGLPNCEVPVFLTNLDKYTKNRLPSFLIGKWIKITLFQDPDWQRPFLSLKISSGRPSRFKLRYYRVTLEEADILIEKFN